jgi:hypothetical protein
MDSLLGWRLKTFPKIKIYRTSSNPFLIEIKERLPPPAARARDWRAGCSTAKVGSKPDGSGCQQRTKAGDLAGEIWCIGVLPYDMTTGAC